MYLPIDIIRMILLCLPPPQCFQIISPLNKQFCAIVHDYLFKKQMIHKIYPDLPKRPHYVERDLRLFLCNKCYECGTGDMGPDICIEHPFYTGRICRSCRGKNVKYAFFSVVEMRNFFWAKFEIGKRTSQNYVFLPYLSQLRPVRRVGRINVYKFSDFFQWLCEQYQRTPDDFIRIRTTNKVFRLIPDEFVYRWMTNHCWY